MSAEIQRAILDLSRKRQEAADRLDGFEERELADSPSAMYTRGLSYAYSVALNRLAGLQRDLETV